MPKPDEKLQEELGIPKGYNVTPIQNDYPKIIQETNSDKAVEKTMSPTMNGSYKKESYDEVHGDYENLHDQYVQQSAIEVSPKSFKE